MVWYHCQADPKLMQYYKGYLVSIPIYHNHRQEHHTHQPPVNIPWLMLSWALKCLHLPEQPWCHSCLFSSPHSQGKRIFMQRKLHDVNTAYISTGSLDKHIVYNCDSALTYTHICSHTTWSHYYLYRLLEPLLDMPLYMTNLFTSKQGITHNNFIILQFTYFCIQTTEYLYRTTVAVVITEYNVL